MKTFFSFDNSQSLPSRAVCLICDLIKYGLKSFEGLQPSLHECDNKTTQISRGGINSTLLFETIFFVIIQKNNQTQRCFIDGEYQISLPFIRQRE